MVADVLETTETIENFHIGIGDSAPKQMVGSIAQLQWTHSNARQNGQQTGEAESTMQQENYDRIAITETWQVTQETGAPQQMATNSSEGIG